ncbi:Myeloid cell surface antigen CD33 [Dissostichus eleginoides]|uniref:Myeloid cell surface antigen CD33 n=1 Tax=Dissostichus eleginoides TaxID=100907 RepID=A0AAD9C3J5_DISEL|nr:Myeloid cell surface antigen CD33 [Dissostichus eleginoides]
MATRGASVWGKQHCKPRNFCITLSDADIPAEAGLCVVIPCSFTTDNSFIPKHMVWYKCENSKCEDSVIFQTKEKNKVQPRFVGRVSLLEPDVSKKKCSIIINDLTESDSGAYRLRVNGDSSGFTFIRKTTVTVKGLTQKPSVTIPALTEGQQTTLTCTAPVLCSGSDPKITWTWRGAGEKDSQITGNITAFKTENLTAISAGEAVQNDWTQDEEAAEGGAVAPPNDDGVPREVEYSDINFSLLKRKCPNGPEATKETTETEYAEVKRKRERQDDGGKDGEKVEGNEEEEVMLVRDKEVEQCMSAEEVEGGQDMALYSNLNEIMGKV